MEKLIGGAALIVISPIAFFLPRILGIGVVFLLAWPMFAFFDASIAEAWNVSFGLYFEGNKLTEDAVYEGLWCLAYAAAAVSNLGAFFQTPDVES